MTTTYDLDDGKYHLVRDDRGMLVEALRNGEPWPAGMETLAHSKVFHAALDEIDRLRAAEPQWVVNDNGELGVCVNGRYFFLYKGDNIEYPDAKRDDGTPMMVRPVGKREFGETCKPIIHMKVENGVLYDRTPYPYREDLVYTPGLSFGSPGDADWRPLPPAPTAPSPTPK